MTVTQNSPAVPPTWVLDTNAVLDVWVFQDPHTQGLRQHLGLHLPRAQRPVWWATAAMRDELARVLTYPHLVRRQPLAAETANQVLAAFDQAVTWCDPAPKAPYTCKDPDDQRFIDLAVSHGANLVSKDKAVLCMSKRLKTQGVRVGMPKDWQTTDCLPFEPQENPIP